MVGKIIVAVGLAGIGLLLFGKGLELVIEYWAVIVAIVGITTLIWLQRKKSRASKAWVSRYQDGRKLRF